MQIDLNQIAINSTFAKGVGKIATQYCGKLFKQHMLKGNVLELEPAEGVMTDILYEKWKDYTIVDGAEYFVKNIRERYADIKSYCCLFEEFKPPEKYDNIILGHVLEHVDNPKYILKLCRKWMKPGGRLLSAVPNSESIHRQAAVKMGILEQTASFSEKDVKHGHQRIYNYNSFVQEFINEKYKIISCGGYWLKPLSDSLIEKDWNIDQINAFLELGESYPEIAGEVYVIAE